MKKLLVLGLCLILAGCGSSETVYKGKPASYWVRALKDPDKRPDAAEALDRLGTHALPALIEGLKNADPAIREGSAAALKRLGKDAVPELTDSLKDGNEAVRWQAAYVLGEIGPDANKAATNLGEILNNKEQPALVRVHAARAIWKVDRQNRTALASLREVLKDTNAPADVRALAAETLGDLGQAPDSWNEPDARSKATFLTTVQTSLVELLAKEQPPLVRVQAARAIAKVDRQNVLGVPVLIEVLKSEDKSEHAGKLRRLAIEALGAIGPDARAASPLLRQTMEDKNQDPQIRVKAAQALWTIDRQAAPLIPFLREALQEPKTYNAAARAWAAFLVGEIGADARPLILELRNALQDEDVTVRKQAAYSLGKIVDRSDSLVVGKELATTALKKGENSYVRVNAARALARVDEQKMKEVLAVLIDALGKEPAAEIRRLAADVLGEIGQPAAATTVGSLVAALKDQSPEVRRAAAEALGKMGAPARPAVTALAERIEDKNEDLEVQMRAARALWQVDQQTESTVPVLRKALKAPSAATRVWAAFTLGEIGPKAVMAVTGLSEVLQRDPDPAVRKQAAHALGKIGPAAVDAVPTLIHMAQTSTEPDVKLQAADALHKIDKAAAQKAGIP